jgi:hypothetical protein
LPPPSEKQVMTTSANRRGRAQRAHGRTPRPTRSTSGWTRAQHDGRVSRRVVSRSHERGGPRRTGGGPSRRSRVPAAGVRRARAQGKRLGRPPLPAEMAERVRAPRASGAPLRTVAKQAGVALSTVRWCVNTLNH